MNRKELIENLLHTPHNTNPNVVNSMLDEFLKEEGGKTPETIILVDENGTECIALLTDEKVDITAYASDIRKGKTAITQNGITTGDAFIPELQSKSVAVRKNGAYEVTPDEGFALNKVVVDAIIMDGIDKDPRVDALISGKIVELDYDDITEIGPKAFYMNANLISVNMPEVTTIYDNAFYYCENLKTISFPKATKIDQYAFYNCQSLTDVDLPMLEEIPNCMLEYAKVLQNINIPNATHIGQYSFSGTSIPIITADDMPKVEMVDYYAFSSCDNLTSATLPMAKELSDGIFSWSPNLKTVDLPEVISIGSDVFNGCSALTTINAPKLEILGTNCFGSCTSLTALDFPSVKEIKGYMFDNWRGDNSITSIRMPSLTTISADVFANMYALKTVDLSTPLQFPNGCFSNCTSLDTLIMRNTDAITTMVDASVMVSIPANALAIVPRSMVESYQNDENWNASFPIDQSKIIALEGYTVDGTITGEIDFEKLESYRGGIVL